MTDLPGQAIHDYYFNKSRSKLWIHNTYGPKEEMPVNIYLRKEEQLPELEVIALQYCRGTILDIGAGAGSHSLVLQKQNKDVTALEISATASEVMKARGVTKVVTADIFEYDQQQYDTLLLLMNGIGLTGTVANLRNFLQYAKKLITVNGQLLFDSSDVAYLYGTEVPEGPGYYGEIQYKYEYRKQQTDWFSWLYIDQQLLLQIAAEEGWKAEILFVDEFEQYLVKLVL